MFIRSNSHHRHGWPSTLLAQYMLDAAFSNCFAIRYSDVWPADTRYASYTSKSGMKGTLARNSTTNSPHNDGRKKVHLNLSKPKIPSLAQDVGPELKKMMVCQLDASQII